MDQNTAIAISVAFISVLSFLYLTTQEIVKFKMKKEQIKAEAMIKAEEIKAKNQLDIEKLIQQDKVDAAQSVNYVETSSNHEEDYNNRRSRLNDRM